jgi:hypothetical protein
LLDLNFVFADFGKQHGESFVEAVQNGVRRYRFQGVASHGGTLLAEVVHLTRASRDATTGSGPEFVAGSERSSVIGVAPTARHETRYVSHS